MDMSILGSLIAHSKQIQCTSLIRDHIEGISDVSVSPFNEYKAAAACFDKTLTEYDINKSKQNCLLSGHEAGIWTCDYSPTQDGLVATGSSDNTAEEGEDGLDDKDKRGREGNSPQDLHHTTE